MRFLDNLKRKSASKNDGGAANIGNFRYLDNLIKGGSKKIVLDSDIILESGEDEEYMHGIVLDADNLLIDGDGHAIDACGKTRIFKVTAKNVTIKNITFKNGYGIKGGAIYNDGGEVNIHDANFLNNAADLGGREVSGFAPTDLGGAIYVAGGVLNMNRAHFEGNAAKKCGAAIYAVESDGNLTDVVFKNNKLKDDSPTVAMDRKCEFTLTDIVFENDSPSAELDIYNKGELVINGRYSSDLSISIINKGTIYAPQSCDKISSYETGKVIQSEDVEGDFTYLDQLIGNAGRMIELDRDITLNFAKGENKTYGDGILIKKKNFIIDGGGHTIDARNLSRIFRVEGKNVTIRNVNFKNGHSKSWGGAIYSRACLTILQSAFLSNDARREGGAIYADGAKLHIEDSSFKHCHAHSDGGAICGKAAGITVLRCDFLCNSSEEYSGGAISVSEEKLEVSDSSFKRNRCKYFGGAIHTRKVNMTIKKSAFSDNYARSDGGALYIVGGSKFNISSCSFCSNKSYEEGGAIYAFHHQKMPKHVSTIGDSKFTDNSAHRGGAFMCRNYSVEIINSIFNENSADYGGAIEGDVVFNFYLKGSRFSKNRAKIYGGAISNGVIRNYYDSFPGCMMVIEDSLISNSKSKMGGAVSNICGNLNVVSCRLLNNEADHGGAIYTVKNEDRLEPSKGEFCIFNISRCDFTGNECDYAGGAICNGYIDYYIRTGDLHIEDSTFENNTGDDVYTDEKFKWITP